MSLSVCVSQCGFLLSVNVCLSQCVYVSLSVCVSLSCVCLSQWVCVFVSISQCVSKDEIVGWVSLTQWTWAWANSRKQWRMGKSSMLPPMGLQRVGFNIVTEQASWLYNCLHVELKPMISSLLSCTLLVFISPNVRRFFHLNDPIGSRILPN